MNINFVTSLSGNSRRHLEPLEKWGILEERGPYHMHSQSHAQDENGLSRPHSCYSGSHSFSCQRPFSYSGGTGVWDSSEKMTVLCLVTLRMQPVLLAQAVGFLAGVPFPYLHSAQLLQTLCLGRQGATHGGGAKNASFT